MTLDGTLVEQVDAAARQLGLTRSAFARDALRRALDQLRERELEVRHRQGYERHPVAIDEFAIAEDDQEWGA